MQLTSTLSGKPLPAITRSSRAPGRASAVVVRNGSKKERKAVSKRLQQKQAEIDQILGNLRTGTAFANPQSLADVIQAIQVRVGLYIHHGIRFEALCNRL